MPVFKALDLEKPSDIETAIYDLPIKERGSVVYIVTPHGVLRGRLHEGTTFNLLSYENLEPHQRASILDLVKDLLESGVEMTGRYFPIQGGAFHYKWDRVTVCDGESLQAIRFQIAHKANKEEASPSVREKLDILANVPPTPDEHLMIRR